jgi:hypothetical protein
MEIRDDTLKILVKEASSSQRKQLKMLIGLILALGGGGGAWMYSTHGQIDEAGAASSYRDARMDRTEKELQATADRVEAIAILLVQQGRHFEEMVRSVAPPGARIPDRPAALDEIEREILRRDSRRGR